MLLEGNFAFVHFFCSQVGIHHPVYPDDDPGHNEHENADDGSYEYHHSFSRPPVVHLAETGEEE